MIKFKICLFIPFLFIPSLSLSRQITLSIPACTGSKTKLEKGLGLFKRQQFLLSAIEFSSAENADCLETILLSKWGYLLALTELNEKDEAFYLSNQVYPEFFTGEYLRKLQVYQAYHFNIYKNPEDKKRVEAFQAWSNQLPEKKSKILAGTLSALIPGAGQVYAGSWQSGIMAFVLNALFLSATLELQDKNLNNTALISGVVFSISYLGNILNAAESASIYNQNGNKPIIENEKIKIFPELQFEDMKTQ